MGEIINSIDRALDIIILLYHERREMGISEIAKELGLYKSTVHRTLITLENKGFIKQNPDNGKYWFGIKLYAIGMLVGDKISFKEIIKPYAKELYDEFREVVNVSILEKSSMDYPRSIIIHKEQGLNQVLTVNPPVGSSSQCHCSAVGKCLLAYSPKKVYEKYIGKSLTKFTRNTIDNWDDLLAELEQVKKQGYAVDNDELEIGLTCIGAPILDKNNEVIAAISLSGPTTRMREGDFEYKIKKVMEIANKISSLLK